MKVAIVYQFIAHYRLPIFLELTGSKNIQYTIIADLKSNSNIKTIDPVLAQTSIKEGGLRLLNVTNKWFLKEKGLWQKGLISKLKENNFDVIIFLGNPYYLTTWLGLIYSKLKGKKTYLWTHGVTSSENGIKWRFRKLFYNLSDGLLLYGHKAKEVMIKNGFSEKKLHVIYNSLNYEKQVKFREQINSLDAKEAKSILFENPELPTIVFVGRLTQQKKLEMIIKAVKILFNTNFKINTLFIGEGSTTDQLKKSVKNYGLGDYFNFYGACYQESKLAELIAACDICVSPGEVGLTAITSLGYGTPVISHDNFSCQMPEYESIIPGFNGALFKHGSIEDLAETIKSWIINNMYNSRRKIQKNCFQVIDEKYNPKNQVRIINEILAKVDES